MPKTDLLELRIHGIANSPPASMLCTTSEKLVRRDGDDQGSFWQIAPQSEAKRWRRLGGSETVEAYSWGNQARTGGSALVRIGRAIVHLAWLFVLPFGLCNLAYWARRDIKGQEEDKRWWAGGDGAIAIRLFALLQTLFYMVGFMTVFVQFVALQCYHPGSGTVVVATNCSALPTWMDFLSTWSPIARSALMSVLPIAIILFIYLISLRAKRLFNPKWSFDDEAMSRGEDSPAVGKPAANAQSPSALTTGPSLAESDVAPPRPALLATTGFWERSRTAHTTERAHLAAAIATVLFLLAYDALLDANPGLGPLDLPFSLEVLASSPLQTAGVILGGMLLVWTVVITAAAGLSGRVVSIRSKRGWSTALLIVTSLLYLGWLFCVLVWFREPSEAGSFAGDRGFRGLVFAPTLIASLGAVIAVASLSWGLGWRRVPVYTLMVLAVSSVGVSQLAAPYFQETLPWLRLMLAIMTVALVVIAIGIAYVPSRNADVQAARRLSAWHGNAAAVAILLALFTSLVITSLLVLGAYAWLTSDTDSPDVMDARRTVATTLEPVIEAPEFYQRFAGMLVVVLAILIVTVALAVAASFRKFPAFSLPKLAFPRGTSSEQREHDAYLGGTHFLPSRYPRNEAKPNGRPRAVANARRVAGLLHRGEPILRVLAILTALALVPLAVPFWGNLLDAGISMDSLTGVDSAHSTDAPRYWEALSAVSGWALGLLAIAAVGLVVTNAVTSAERPLGLVWDIVCFFPGAGHPFGPPCYGERAVPEVTKRIRQHSRENGQHARILLSAHSMGATIAVAAIFALHAKKDDAHLVHHVGLLTHGVQLRAYFSRFFPQVFGPRVLGIQGTSGPALLRRDPWQKQVEVDWLASGTPAHQGDPPTLVSLLGGDQGDPTVPPRWRNLWRRTDPLGFPMTGYWNRQVSGVKENPIDRGATERSPRTYLWTIARHDDYLSTLQYTQARQELLEQIRSAD